MKSIKVSIDEVRDADNILSTATNRDPEFEPIEKEEEIMDEQPRVRMRLGTLI